MTDCLPPTLLEACVVVGASHEKLQEVYEAVNSNISSESLLLEPEVLHVLAPPFLTRPAGNEGLKSLGKRHRSFLRKKKEHPPSDQSASESKGGSEDFGVPKNIDLMALPQLCFPEPSLTVHWCSGLLLAQTRTLVTSGLQVTREDKKEQFHFLVFTDVFGNKTHGVVMQYYRPVQGGMPCYQNGTRSSKFSKHFSAVGVCVISKYPYFTALKDCLSCLLFQLSSCRLSEMEESLKEFVIKLSLVPIPPPGQLHLMFTLRPLTIMLPSREDKNLPTIDLDLHLPFLCFRPQQLLLVLSCLLQEQRIVLFSADLARLTLIAESLFIFLQPLTWQHPYVPVLARGMLDFLMAPTAFLMGCHLSHYAEVAAETDDLVLVNIDDGNVSTFLSDAIDIPEIPLVAADYFTRRSQSLQIHFDLDQYHSASCLDINEQRAQRRAWQQKLNHEIQKIALELLVNIFRDVSSHLNYEHRVFHSEEFLKTRKPDEQLFYKTVLDTHIFHSFLRDRLNKKMDNFARMELDTRSEMQKMMSMVEVPRRPTVQEIVTRRKTSIVGNKLSKRLGMSLPNLRGYQTISFERNPLLTMVAMSESALKTPPNPVKVFKLPDFPVFLSSHSVQAYYSELIQLLGKAIFLFQNENSALVARFYYLRGFINTLCSRPLDALSDFQNLNKTDTAIFPTHLVTWLVDSLHQDELQQAHKRPELKGLIFKIKMDNEKTVVQTENHIKKFELPQNPLGLDEFVRCIQQCGIVKDVATIHRLFDALTDGQHKMVDPEVFRVFYTFWKEMEAEAQDVNLPSEIISHLDNSECVYKLSSCVKTSYGVGKIALTQKRLFLLTEGQPGFLEITKFRDIQEVKMASAPLLLVRIPSLRIRTFSRPELFEANLKMETELWNLIIKEMWAGRKMADQDKDPQYMTQALTNVLLMDAVVGCLHPHRSISAASKLVYFDKIIHEVHMTVPSTTSETLKHKINPSLDLAEPQTVCVLLYTPGQLRDKKSQRLNPKLWVALSGGRVVVFDAASWSMLQDCIQMGESQVTCMAGLVQDQVWMGSQDSVIYIIDTHSMSCNKQLTEHRHEVTGLTLDIRSHSNGQLVYSCSCDGTILQWDSSSLKVKRQFYLCCDRLCSIRFYDGVLWCCCGDSIVELKKNGTPHRRIVLPDDLQSIPSCFSCFIVVPEAADLTIKSLLQCGQVWTGCSDSVELCLWQTNNLKQPPKRISLPGTSGVTCLIRVKNQIWVGCRGWSRVGGLCDGQLKSLVLVVDLVSLTVTKELLAHSDSIQTLCSAEDRYVLSGSARRDGKIAIWQVE